MAGPRMVAERFALSERLGQGGMGIVWRATDELLGREVAVKQVQTHRAGHERLIREARAAARLNHPGAVTVHDVVSDEDEVFIVMELVAAPTLADLVERDGPLPRERVARIGLGLLEVLAEAHRIGIVHRDVKPANVMVLTGDRIKLADFGVARISGDPTLTREGTVLGSPAYMSPEQTRGERGHAATDMWALGATLYYAVEGVVAFGRETYEGCIAAVLTQPPPPPLRSGADLGGLLLALLEKDAAHRPATGDIRRTLECVAAGTRPAPDPSPLGGETSVDAAEQRPASRAHTTDRDPKPRLSQVRDLIHGHPPAGKGTRAAARRRTLIAALSAVFALALAVPVWLVLRDPAPRVGAVEHTLRPRRPTGPLIRRLSLCRAEGANVNDVTSIATTAVSGRPTAIAGCEGGTTRSADLTSGSPGRSYVVKDALLVQSVAVGTLGGRQVVVAGTQPGGSSSPDIAIWDLASGSRAGKAFSGNVNGVTSVRIGMLHGRQVVVSGSFDTTIYTWDPATGHPVAPRIDAHSEVISLALTTLDGRRVVVEGGYGATVRVWDVATGAQVGRAFAGHRSGGADTYVRSVALGTVGERQVAVSTGDDDTIQVSDLATGRPVGAPIAAPAGTAAVTSVRRRQVIVSGDSDGAVRLWDLATHKPIGRPLVDAGHGRVSALTTMTLNGHPVALAGYADGTVGVWRLDIPGA